MRLADPLRTAARLVWASIPGPTLDAEARALIGTGIGGIVLFSRNVVDPPQIARLCAAIRSAAPGPVRISIDQEGGHVVRVAEPLTHFPSPMAVGATRDPRIARSSLTLVRDDARWLPIARGARVALVDLAPARPSPVEDDRGETTSLGAAVEARFPGALCVRVEPRSGAGLSDALAAAAAADVTILATRDACASPEARLVVSALGDAGVVRVALRSPADLLLEPACSTAVAAYTDTPATAEAIAAALADGPAAFRGRLPVRLSPADVAADAA